MQKELRRANHLMSKGEHNSSASIFLSLAKRAQDRGIIRPASMLFLQAALAFILAGDINAALEQAYQGLEMLAAEERWTVLNREGERIIGAMEEEGQQESAKELRAWLSAKLKDKPLPGPTGSSTKSRVQLPEKCPYCGASMSLEQLNAGEARAAECHYCGSIVLPSQIK